MEKETLPSLTAFLCLGGLLIYALIALFPLAEVFFFFASLRPTFSIYGYQRILFLPSAGQQLGTSDSVNGFGIFSHQSFFFDLPLFRYHQDVAGF